MLKNIPANECKIDTFYFFMIIWIAAVWQNRFITTMRIPKTAKPSFWVIAADMFG